MMAEKVTSSQVAERAGVSRSAVSRVFTPGASASSETVDKVRRAAEELGYRPNALARSLLTGSSRMIGLVVSYLDNHFYPPLLERLSHALQEEGYHILMFMAGPEGDQAEAVVEDILDYQVDGLVLASVGLSSDLADRCRAMGVPVVLLNRRQGDPGEAAVISDSHAGGRMAAEHLVAQGARRIGHIAGWEGASTQREREAGLLAGLRAAGLGLHCREVGNFDAAQARQATITMFEDPAERPDGLFVANDYMALVVLDTLRHELGLSVPRDVRVVGFDNVPAGAFPAYGLTTIGQDTNAMAARTVALLTGKNVPAAEPLPVQLIPRASS
ncbi:MAG: LacI family DNA-binding transcriptional regulator [Pseudomonadota bacterium]